MSYPNRQEVTFFDNVTPVAVTSSTDATPIVVTATAHGLATGDRVFIYGHTTNVAANGIFKVTVLTANTFQLIDEITGASVAGSGAGAGSSGLLVKAPPVCLVSDFKTLDFFLGTSGSATVTVAVIGSLGVTPGTTTPKYDRPNMGATASRANPWTFMQIVDLATGNGIAGSTGIVVAGTDIADQYEVNCNLTKYLTIIPISWSAGALSIKGVFQTPA